MNKNPNNLSYYYWHIILIFSLLLNFIFTYYFNIKVPQNFMNKNELFSYIVGNLYVDLGIIFIALSGIIYTGKNLKLWYQKYRLSSVLADILVITIVIILLTYLLKIFKIKVNLFQFTLLALCLQIIHDIIFYLIFNNIKKGKNHMLDFFKDYAMEIGHKAIIGDSVLVSWVILISSLFNKLSLNKRIILFILGLYLTPYILYMKG